MVAADAVSRNAKPPAFVELMASGSSGVPECTLELEGGKGRLRILCKGARATELAELSRALWDVAC
jgi:hypothetical protein